jgi:hypothetical protein
MKLRILVTLAALALVGSAQAQPGNPGAPMASDFEGTTTDAWHHERTIAPREQATQAMLRSVQAASSRMHLSCAADRARLCADSKPGFSADRCVEAHRKDLAAPCRAALAEIRTAWSAPH